MMENMDFVSLVVPPKERLTGPAWWFAIQEDKVLVQQESAATAIPLLDDFAELALPILRRHYLGRLGGRHCFTVEVPRGS